MANSIISLGLPKQLVGSLVCGHSKHAHDFRRKAVGVIAIRCPPCARPENGRLPDRGAAIFRPRCLIPGFEWGILIFRIKGCAMGQVLHGSATTTEAVRRAIQHSQESLRALAKRYGILGPQTP